MGTQLFEGVLLFRNVFVAPDGFDVFEGQCNGPPNYILHNSSCAIMLSTCYFWSAGKCILLEENL